MIKYAVIKLVTGEELFSQIEEFEEDKDSLILMDPCIIKELPNNRKGPFALYKIDTWLNLTNDHMFCLKMDHIVHWSRSDDKEKIHTYINNAPSVAPRLPEPEVRRLFFLRRTRILVFSS